MRKFRCIDLFAGAGGFSNGFVEEGFEVKLAIDKFEAAAETYKRNHEGVNFLREDIKTINENALLENLNIKSEEVDVIIGGPPCQGFSTVGKRSSNDVRNQLFEEYVRIVEYLNPRYFVMENVTGILNIQRGEFLQRILDSFENVGYKVKYKTLNALNYGVPQNRERVIFIGSRGGEEVVFPRPTHAEEANSASKSGSLKKPLTLWDAISDLPPVKAGEKATEYLSPPENSYQKARRNGVEKLTLHKATRHGDRLIEMMNHIPEGNSVWEVENMPAGLRPNSGYKNTYARLDSSVPAMTITRNFSCVSSSRCIHPFQNRGLTAREAARIQSFDDDFIFQGTKGEVAVQIGNAVPPVLARQLAKCVKKLLLK